MAARMKPPGRPEGEFGREAAASNGSALTRRSLLGAGGALVVGFAAGALRAEDSQDRGSAPKPVRPELPGSLKVQPLLDGWIRIGADGRITVFTGKAELGQGLKTALRQVAAEELLVPIARIDLLTADTELTANEGYTAGSHSMQDSGTAIRHAAAQVRALLAGLAARRLGMPADQLGGADGVFEGGGQRVSYAELVAGLSLHVPAAPQSVLRDPKTHTVVGKSVPRVDIPAKVSGGAAYLQDLRPAGMVHGRILRLPEPNARLAALDSAAVEAMPGVIKVVRDGRFVGVVAEREFQAVTAQRALAAAARWEPGAPSTPPLAFAASLRSAPAQDFVIHDVGTPAGGGRTLEARYGRPYQLHGSIGPSCAIAQRAGTKTTVWTHTQGVYPLRDALAEMLGVSRELVHCIHVEGSGCYGHNGADDVAADAALLARALPGRPVRVQWMREDEHGREPFGPPMTTTARATLDGAGRIASWDYAVWSNSHSSRPGRAGDLLAASQLADPFPPSPPKPIPQPEGGGDRNAIPGYAFANARVTHHFLPQAPRRVSALRSLGAYLNVFSIESFMDELAGAATADPVAFRLAHTADPRARDAIRAAADRFGWSTFQRGPMRGRGFAFARYKNLAAYCAIACEVEVRRDTGEIRVLRTVAAVDSGEAVNPDGIRNQIEGGIVQSLSWTTHEAVGFDGERVASLDWGGYPILRFPQVPEQLEVIVLDRPGERFLGTGEASQGPTAAAIANAVADASGVRMRELPLDRERVRAALGA